MDKVVPGNLFFRTAFACIESMDKLLQRKPFRCIFRLVPSSFVVSVIGGNDRLAVVNQASMFVFLGGFVADAEDKSMQMQQNIKEVNRVMDIQFTSFGVLIKLTSTDTHSS